MQLIQPNTLLSCIYEFDTSEQAINKLNELEELKEHLKEKRPDISVRLSGISETIDTCNIHLKILVLPISSLN